MAQAIKASGRDLYYHTWRKEGSTHSFEIDFLVTSKNKVVPIEVKSAAINNYKSINNFEVKYSKQVGESTQVKEDGLWGFQQVLRMRY